MTHFEKAIKLFGDLSRLGLEFGREVKRAMIEEGKTIRDISIALAGNSSLEDKIGRYVQAAEFADSLNPYQYGNVIDWLTVTHFTELRKIENAYDHAYAVDVMQDCIIDHDDYIEVKPVEWLRAKRENEEISTAEMKHRFWKRATRILAELMSDLERKGLTATKEDRRVVRLLKMIVRIMQAEAEPEGGRG